MIKTTALKTFCEYSEAQKIRCLAEQNEEIGRLQSEVENLNRRETKSSFPVEEENVSLRKENGKLSAFVKKISFQGCLCDEETCASCMAEELLEQLNKDALEKQERWNTQDSSQVLNKNIKEM